MNFESQLKREDRGDCKFHFPVVHQLCILRMQLSTCPNLLRCLNGSETELEVVHAWRESREATKTRDEFYPARPGFYSRSFYNGKWYQDLSRFGTKFLFIKANERLCKCASSSITIKIWMRWIPLALSYQINTKWFKSHEWLSLYSKSEKIPRTAFLIKLN